MIGGRFDYGLGACECPQFFFCISFGFSLYGLYNINVTSFRAFMEKQFNIGRHNCLDDVMMKDSSVDKMVECINKGIGEFHHYNEDGKDTEDERYIVTCDVSDKFDDIPFDLGLWNAHDEIIEIYRRTR